MRGKVRQEVPAPHGSLVAGVREHVRGRRVTILAGAALGVGVWLLGALVDALASGGGSFTEMLWRGPSRWELLTRGGVVVLALGSASAVRSWWEQRRPARTKERVRGTAGDPQVAADEPEEDSVEQLRDQIHHLNRLQRITEELQRSDRGPEKVLQQVVELVREAMGPRGGVSLELAGLQIRSHNFLETPLRIGGDITAFETVVGNLTVYLEVERAQVPESTGGSRTEFIRQVCKGLGQYREQQQAQHDMTQSRQRLRHLAARLQTQREEERERISRQLYEELGQDLTGLKYGLALLESRLKEALTDGSHAALQERLQAMAGQIDAMAQHMRSVAAELRPSILDDIGLHAAVIWHVRELEKETGLEATCTLEEEVDQLDRSTATAVFRIIQEALTNVILHAEASRIQIEIEMDQSSLTLVIEDDGRGITPRELSSPASLGLLGMRERALLLGGAMHVNGVPEVGTTLTLCMPVAPRKNSTLA